MVYPSGIAFDTMAHPTLDTTGQIYVTNNCSSIDSTGLCISQKCTSSKFEVDGSVTVYDADAEQNAAPNLTIEGCNTLLGSPLGIFVDEATVNVCTGTAATAADLCNPSSVSAIVPVPTRRIWVVNAEGVDNAYPDSTFAYVSVYAPELAAFLGVSNCAPNSSTGKPVCNEPPVAGIFSTAAGNGDASLPQFMAINETEATAYITDLDIRFGKLKAFNLVPTAECLSMDSNGNCKLAVSPFVSANFRSSLSGPRTSLYNPVGVSTISTAAGDEVFVANLRANSFVEFGPGVALNGGDVAPLALIKGGRTKLNEPVGVAISPPPLIP